LLESFEYTNQPGPSPGTRSLFARHDTVQSSVAHWKLTLAYDGTPFHGWQIQPGLPTVQGTLSDALHRIAGERVLPQGSGRTDTGVHALGQVASFLLNAPIPPANLQRALNGLLPASIRVMRAERAPVDFHARHSAIAKTYEYRILHVNPECDTSNIKESEEESAASTPARICPPILAPYVWPCRWPLSLAALNAAAAHILGSHDFTSFAATDPDQSNRGAAKDEASREQLATGNRQPATFTRTITCSCWHARDGLLIYTVTGSGFLHHMVRNLVGTFVQAGADRIPADSIPTILAAHNRSAAGPTAPASGLFLVSVQYPDGPLSTDNWQLTTGNLL
jgi:tRNA pseudouridine38-40 synthase